MCEFTNHLNAEKYATKCFFDLNVQKTSVVFICLIKYSSLFLTYKYQNGYDPYLYHCLCFLSSGSIDKKRLRTAVFKLKKMYYWKHNFFGLMMVKFPVQTLDHLKILPFEK